MANFFKITSDRPNFFIILVDSSGSMASDTRSVEEGLKVFKESFNNFEFASSVIVSVCLFDTNFYPRDFRPVKEMNIRYSADGGTALSFAIVEAEEHLNRYVEEFVKRTNITPQVSFICISDGRPEYDKLPLENGMEAIKRMNCAGVNTAFAALGHKVDAEFGRKMGFMATIDIRDRAALRNFLGVTLSDACKEQSRSRKPLGSNFFSQANEISQSQDYSQEEEQALEDFSWIDEI